MKTLGKLQPGKRGLYVTRGGRYGRISRAYVVPRDPRTEAQMSIRRARQRRDFPLGQLGRKPLQPDVRETHRGHRAAQFHRATGDDFQTEQGEIHFSARRRLSDLRKRNFLFRRDSCFKLRSWSPNESVLDGVFG